MRLPPLGPGPVFVYEWLTTTRRWQLYALRSAFVGLILLGIFFVWYAEIGGRVSSDQEVSIDQAAQFGSMLYATIVVIELSLVLLAAPAATAGAICLDKARGTLDHMLTTDLSNAEIVLGKLGARLIPVIGLVACVLPVTALIGLLGGVASETMLGGFLTTLGSAIFACSLSLVLSVWGRKTHEVLMLTYLIIVIWLLLPLLVPFGLWILIGGSNGRPAPINLDGIMEALAYTNPYALLFSTDWRSGVTDNTVHFLFVAAYLALSAILIALATVRIRRVVLRQSGVALASSTARQPFWKRPFRVKRLPRRQTWFGREIGPSLDGNPVFWREWHMARPTGMLRVARALYAALGFFFALTFIKALAQSPLQVASVELGVLIAFQVSLGLLLLSVSAATSLAEERVRGSLDVLLTTPMSTRSILLGKWWGAFRQVRSPLFWAALLGAPFVGDGQLFSYLLMLALIAAYGAAIASLGLELATTVSRLGRAVAFCVSAYVLLATIWPFFVAIVFRDVVASAPLMIGSPPIGTFWAAANAAPEYYKSYNHYDDLTEPILFWTLFYLAVAALLFMKTVKSFDHHLGRIAEKSRHSKPQSARRAK